MFSDDFQDREFYTNWPNWSDMIRHRSGLCAFFSVHAIMHLNHFYYSTFYCDDQVSLYDFAILYLEVSNHLFVLLIFINIIKSATNHANILHLTSLKIVK